MTSIEAMPAVGAPVRGRRRPVQATGVLVLVVVLVALMLASVTVGSRDVAWSDVVAALGGSTEGFDQAAVAKRIPRTWLAVLAGAALAVSGAVMQGVTRNPLADPGVLGVNTGASLAVVAGIAFFGLSTATSFIWVAIIGAGITAVLVYAVGSLGRGGATPLKLALAGAATSAAGLGERVAVARGAAALGAVVLCGAATAVTGPIGFVGLVVPHACRLLVGVDHRRLLPCSALAGAALLTAADVLGRIVARPAEIDVGIITALIGAPFFIHIVRRQKVRAL